VALVQGRTLKEVQYHLKTKLGISKENYKHCNIHPIYGTGQGSGNSPTVLLVVNSILFGCYVTRAFGATFESLDCTVCLCLFQAGFINKTASCVNEFLKNIPPTPEALTAKFTRYAQCWSDLLCMSALELPKCIYHYWNYLFTSAGQPFLQSGQIGPAVQIKVGDHTVRPTPSHFVLLMSPTRHGGTISLCAVLRQKSSLF
jgi:hypothetical protein